MMLLQYMPTIHEHIGSANASRHVNSMLVWLGVAVLTSVVVALVAAPHRRGISAVCWLFVGLFGFAVAAHAAFWTLIAVGMSTRWSPVLFFAPRLLAGTLVGVSGLRLSLGTISDSAIRNRVLAIAALSAHIVYFQMPLKGRVVTPHDKFIPVLIGVIVVLVVEVSCLKFLKLRDDRDKQAASGILDRK